MNMKKIERGDIYYVYKCRSSLLGDRKTGRPAVVVSNDTINKENKVVQVVYLTTRAKTPSPTQVTIRSASQLSIALCGEISAAPKDCVGDYIGHVTATEMKEIEEAMQISLGIDPYACDSEMAAELAAYKKMYEDVLNRLISGGR